MPASVEKLPNEPILLVTIDGHYDASIAQEVYDQIAELISDLEPPIYRITDVRKQESSFSEMLEVIELAKQGGPGSTTDPRIVNIFVGRFKMMRIAQDVYKRIDPQGHGVLDTVEDALTYVRWQLSKNNDDLTT